MPIMFATGFVARTEAQEVSVIEQITMSLFGMAMMLVVNGYLLATRGQTVGKFLTRIQIIDDQNGQLLPFFRLFGYRYLWMLPLTMLVAVIIDSLFIFGAARCCLHDYIAGTEVVLYQAHRQGLT